MEKRDDATGRNSEKIGARDDAGTCVASLDSARTRV
jgi:hypothetical protein